MLEVEEKLLWKRSLQEKVSPAFPKGCAGGSLSQKPGKSSQKKGKGFSSGFFERSEKKAALEVSSRESIIKNSKFVTTERFIYILLFCIYMKVIKYLFGLFMLFAVLGIAFGFNYAVECNNQSKVLIWGEWKESSTINIKVLDLNGSMVFEGSPQISRDYENMDKSGIYYTEISLEQGKYIVLVDKGSSSESEVVEVTCNSKGFFGKILSISEEGSKFKVYVNIKNNGTPWSGKIKLYYRGGSIEKQVDLGTGDNLISFVFDNLGISNSLFVLSYPDGYDYKLYKKENAGIGNFEVYADEIWIRKGETIDYTFEIKNLENYKVTYDIKFNTNLEVDPDEIEITLGPNETKQVNIQIHADREFSDIPYFSILVDSKEYNFEVHLLGAKGFEVTSNLPDSVLENSIVNGKLTVKNIGDYEEKVDFYYTVNEHTYNYPYEITLEPGEAFTYPIYFVVGNKDTTFEAYINGKKMYSKNIIVKPIIKQFYAYIENTELNTYYGENVETDLIIQNTGNVKDEFKVLTEGNIVANVTKLSLEPNEIGKVKLTLFALKYGKQSFNVTVCNDECHTYQVDLFVDMPVEERATVLLEDKVKFVPNETFNFTLTIENNYPISEQTYVVEFNNTTVSVITLKPNETKQVVIPLEFNESKNYTAKIKVTSAEGFVFEKEIEFVPIEKNKVPTGAFYFNVSSPHIWALIILAVIGAGLLGYQIFIRVKEKLKIEKTVISNEFR